MGMANLHGDILAGAYLQQPSLFHHTYHYFVHQVSVAAV